MNALPSIQIDTIHKVVDDGCHNGFTDLCRFRGRYYLAYRANPTGHGIHPGSAVVVLQSDDGRNWAESFRFSVTQRDVRDPHFLVFRDTLFVYSGSWLCDPATPDGGHDLFNHLGYAAWTGDGEQWRGPRALEETRGYYIWRAAARDGTAYLGGRGGHPPGPMLPWRREIIFNSSDGLTWMKPDDALHETDGSETAFLFEDDGTLLALSRGLKDASICRAKPPYTTWSRTSLGRFIGGPLLTRWGSRRLVGGRKRIGDGQTRTVLSWLVDDRLVDALELPSGGDNAYPGFVAFSDTEGLLSYYSSHEGSGTLDAPSQIYVARIRLKEMS